MNLRTGFSIGAMEFRKILSYRVDFWVQFLGTVIVQILVSWFLWKAVFAAKDVDQIGGYNFHQLIFYYLMVPLFDRLNRGYDNFVLSREIYSGALTRYLVYPVSFFSYKYAGQMARALFSILQLLLAVGIFAFVYGFPENYSVTIWQLAMCFSLSWLAGLCYFFLAAAVEMVAFWADSVWSLMVMLRFSIQMLGGALLPMEMYPKWAQEILFATPFPHLIATPIRLFMGQAGSTEFVQGVVTVSLWTLVFYVACRLMWRAGTREYSGVGI